MYLGPVYKITENALEHANCKLGNKSILRNETNIAKWEFIMNKEQQNIFSNKHCMKKSRLQIEFENVVAQMHQWQ